MHRHVWSVLFMVAWIAGPAAAQLPDGGYNTAHVSWTEQMTFQRSVWVVVYDGEPPNCVERVVEYTVPSFVALPHSWELDYYGDSRKAPLCMRNGTLSVRAPETSSRPPQGTWSRTFNPVDGIVTGWMEPETEALADEPADGCYPLRRRERSNSYRQLFNLRTMMTTDDGYESVERSYQGNRLVRVETVTSRREPRQWAPFTLANDWSPGCDDTGLVVWDRSRAGVVSGVTTGAEDVELRWREAQPEGQPPTLALTRSDAIADVGAVTYLGADPSPNGVTHRWRYEPPAAVGTRTAPTITAVVRHGSVEKANGAFGLYAPPVVLVHGLWSDQTAMYALQEILDLRFTALAAWEFADYRAYNAQSFAAPEVQNIVRAAARRALSAARLRGIAASRVDLVGHSMGGLAAAVYAHGVAPAGGDPPAGALVTIGSPMLGSPLAPWLTDLADTNTPTCATLASTDPSRFWLPFALLECGVETITAPLRPSIYLANRALAAGPALQALTQGSADLQLASAALQSHPPYAIAGSASESTLERLFAVLSFFAGDGRSLDAVLGSDHDTIVPVSSQRAFGPGVTLADHVHTTLLFGSRDLYGNIQEMQSDAVAERVICVLAGESCSAALSPAPSVDKAPSARADDIFTAILAGRTRITPTFGQVTTVPALQQFVRATITLRSPSGCALERAWWWPARQPFSYVEGSPFVLGFAPNGSGSVRVAVLGLCGGNRYFVAASELAVGAPTAQIAFRQSDVLMEAGTCSFVALTGGAPDDFDAYPLATVTSSRPNVAGIEPATHRLCAHGPGSTVVHAVLGSSTADLSVSVVTSLDMIFADGFDAGTAASPAVLIAARIGHPTRRGIRVTGASGRRAAIVSMTKSSVPQPAVSSARSRYMAASARVPASPDAVRPPITMSTACSAPSSTRRSVVPPATKSLSGATATSMRYTLAP